MSKKAKSLFPHTVPDNKEYNFNPLSGILKILFLIFGIILLLALFHGLWSCNPYKKLPNREPHTTQDTTNLLNRAKTVLKTPEPKVLPGKVVTKYIPVDRKVKVLDTAKLKSIVDSLNEANRELQLDNAVDCTRQVNEAFNTGYKYAKDQCDKITYEEKLPDTIIVPELSASNIKLQTERDIYKGQATGRLWVMIGLIAGIIGLLFLLFKKKTNPLNAVK